MPAIEKKQIGKLIFLWIAINFVMTLAWSLQVSYFYKLEYLQSFRMTLIRVYFISSLSPLCGTYIGHRFSNRPVFIRILYIVPASIAGAMAGFVLSEYLVSILFTEIDKDVADSMYHVSFATSLIASVLISLLGTTIGVLMEKNRNYEKRIEMLGSDLSSGAAAESGAEFVTFKNRDLRNKIRIEEILYLTSTGKHTIVHTVGGDIEIPLLLKDVSVQLPAALFIRVHKKHFVNISRIGGLRHIHAGSYQLNLNDEDDSIIPVGRKYLMEIQALFNRRTNVQSVKFQDI